VTDRTITQGDTNVLQATLTDQNGTLIDDSGAAYTLMVKYAFADADTAALITATATQTTPGNAFLTINPSDTAAMTCPSVLAYQITAEETSGRMSTIDSGKLIVMPGVFKDTA
jgi:hypothetical protein